MELPASPSTDLLRKLSADGEGGEELMEAVPWEVLSRKDLPNCRHVSLMYWITCSETGEWCDCWEGCKMNAPGEL